MSEARSGAMDSPKHPSNMHTVFLGECTQYFQWMSIGMYHSHKKSGQPGPITRVMCCSDEEREALPQSWLELGPTHVARSMAHNPHNGDTYGAYNKPYAVIDFLENSPPKEDWLVIVDSDMIMRLPFLCNGSGFDHGEDVSLEMNCQRGRPISAYYGYLQGTNNDLARRHIPEILPRNDTEGGQPLQRQSDQVGGFVVVHRDDMLQYMNDWLTITEHVRDDPEAWHLSGDMYSTNPGMKPWISEMYGYSFAAAKHGMWHQTDQLSMQYPGYLPLRPARLMHYGLLFTVNTTSTPFQFDKHHHFHFDALSCSLTQNGGDLGGLFPMPPRIHELTSPMAGRERLGDLMAIETVLTLNEAFCRHHQTHCVVEERTVEANRLVEQCKAVEMASEELRAELWRIGNIAAPDPGALCQDYSTAADCKAWAANGDCISNPGLMATQCVLSCSMCLPVIPRTQLALVGESQSHHHSSIGETGKELSLDPPQAQGEADKEPEHGTVETDAGHQASVLVVEAPNLRQDTIQAGSAKGAVSDHRDGRGAGGAQLRAVSARPGVQKAANAEHTGEHGGQAPAPQQRPSVQPRRPQTTVQSQVATRAARVAGDIQDHDTHIRDTDGSLATAPNSLPAAYGMACMSLWLLVVAVVLALGSATRKRQRRTCLARNGPRTQPRSQNPDIGEFL